MINVSLRNWCVLCCIFKTKFWVFSLVDSHNCLSASSPPHRQWFSYSAHPGVHIFSIIQLMCPENKSRCFYLECGSYGLKGLKRLLEIFSVSYWYRGSSVMLLKHTRNFSFGAFYTWLLFPQEALWILNYLICINLIGYCIYHGFLVLFSVSSIKAVR